MHSSLLVLLALLGGAHAFASTPATEKGRLSRDSFVFDLDDLDAAASSLCSCNYAGDGECDDGGEGSQHSVCELGSDGSDCADRGTKGCTVPQCAVGEYHQANAQGGFDCVKPGLDGCPGAGHFGCPGRVALSCFSDGVPCGSGLGVWDDTYSRLYESYTFEGPAVFTGTHFFPTDNLFDDYAATVGFQGKLRLAMDEGQAFDLKGLKIRSIVLDDWQKEPQFTIRGSNGYEASLSFYKYSEDPQPWYWTAEESDWELWNSKDWSINFNGVTWIEFIVEDVMEYSVDSFRYTACLF